MYSTPRISDYVCYQLACYYSIHTKDINKLLFNPILKIPVVTYKIKIPYVAYDKLHNEVWMTRFNTIQKFNRKYSGLYEITPNIPSDCITNAIKLLNHYINVIQTCDWMSEKMP